MTINSSSSLKNAIRSRYKSNRDFIEAFEQAGGVIDETVLSRQLNGSRGLSSAWLSAYNIFFNKLNLSEMKLQTSKQVNYIESDRILQPEQAANMLAAYNKNYGESHYDTIVVGNGLTFWRKGKDVGYCGWDTNTSKMSFEMDCYAPK